MEVPKLFVPEGEDFNHYLENLLRKQEILEIQADYGSWKPDYFSIRNYNLAISILEKMSKHPTLFNKEIKTLKEKIEVQKEAINWRLPI